jgi:hypothetical protein
MRLKACLAMCASAPSADSSLWNNKLMARLQKAGCLYSISILVQAGVAEQIASIPETDWQTLEDYPEDGEAQIAETTLHGKPMIVRRTRLVGPKAQLWPDWRYFPFLINRTEPLELVEAEHRQHAVVQLTIRDLKDQALAHFPSAVFNVNSPWTVIACLLSHPTLTALVEAEVSFVAPAPAAKNPDALYAVMDP